MDREKVIEKAIWEGDLETLSRVAACVCCCHEHTFGSGCPAWAWGGCRGYGSGGLTESQEEQAWLLHYVKFHGMTTEQFYGME